MAAGAGYLEQGGNNLVLACCRAYRFAQELQSARPSRCECPAVLPPPPPLPPQVPLQCVAACLHFTLLRLTCC